MLTLRETVDQQRDQMKVVNKENNERQLEVEAVSLQVFSYVAYLRPRSKGQTGVGSFSRRPRWESP